jgi:hypothetical protein
MFLMLSPFAQNERIAPSRGAHCDRAVIGGAPFSDEKDPGFFAALRMTQK